MNQNFAKFIFRNSVIRNFSNLGKNTHFVKISAKQKKFAKCQRKMQNLSNKKVFEIFANSKY